MAPVAPLALAPVEPLAVPVLPLAVVDVSPPELAPPSSLAAVVVVICPPPLVACPPPLVDDFCDAEPSPGPTVPESVAKPPLAASVESIPPGWPIAWLHEISATSAPALPIMGIRRVLLRIVMIQSPESERRS
jgi:hypothetical protein